MSELHKKNFVEHTHQDFYFWRAYDGEEIDIVLEKDGKLVGYECKWKSDKDTMQKSIDAPMREVSVITTENFIGFLS